MGEIKLFLGRIYRSEAGFKRWNTLVIVLVLTVICGAALLALVVDPHYRYHEPFFYDKVYYEIYATAPNLLQHDDYTLLMLGTSMTRNFFIADIEKTFGEKAIKLAASGGTMRDLKKFFDVALAAKQKKLRRVVFLLDIYALNKADAHWTEFDYMYRHDHREDYRYLFSRKTFSNMFYLVKRKQRPKRQRIHQTDRNRMFSTEYKGKPYGWKEVMKDALHNEMSHHSMTPYDPEIFQKNFHNELLPMFDRNPDIEFTVYLPPYHIYTYCQSEHFGEADALITQKTWVMKELLKRKNVVLHDFQAAEEIVCKHEYFSDVQHFCNDAAQIILKDLLNGSKQIKSAAQADESEKRLRALIAGKMPEYYQDMKKIQGGK